ncbi:MAG TPA: AAA family ATPase [Bacteroidales bacterium]|nr:AAA family ATPase [Bacteroidales bacterium]HPS15910.1 AAA family ATPase [Bacteroidales bacterium]
MIKRAYNLSEHLKEGKVLVIYGARRVGKTTIVRNYLEQSNLKFKADVGDDMRIRRLFESLDLKLLKEYAEGYELIFIDEAQQIPKVGNSLKLLIDNIPGLKIIATGSSSFELSGMIGEPLTGRKNTLLLFSFSHSELSNYFSKYDLRQQIEDFLIYGCYPEVVLSKSRQEKISCIEELVNSYLLKDILTLDKIKSPVTLSNLLKLLAFQIGSPVSLNELSTKLHIDIKTVGRYLDLLEKSFVIKKINGYSNNLRDEVTSKCKYYFLDNGIRNGVISLFNKIEDRNDIGQLWENFMVSERIKKITYDELLPVQYHFWRNYSGKETDWIEIIDGKMTAYEFKWKAEKSRQKQAFTKIYTDVNYHVVNSENYLDFLL